MQYAILYVNGVPWDVQPAAWSTAVNEWVGYMTDPAYLRVNGVPAFFVFDVGQVRAIFGSAAAVNTALGQLRAAAQAQGLPGVYIIGGFGTPDGTMGQETLDAFFSIAQSDGYDALALYNYPFAPPPVFGMLPFSTLSAAGKWVWDQARLHSSLPFIPTAMAGWDPRPLDEVEPISHDLMWYSRTPQDVAAFVSDAITWAQSNPTLRVEPSPDEPMVLIEAWNELSEGSYIVPTVGDGTSYGDALAAMLTGSSNYGGLWWASPAGSESGWGINFAHQGDTIFATWFTYDATGKGLWLVMTAPKTAPNTYAGTLYSTTGPAFNAVPFNPANVVATAVGNGTLTFADTSNGTFAYTVSGTNQNKAITREVFGTLPNCATATGSLAAATNYTDLWWASPAGSESGWGINLNHEGTTIFATWFTYALNGNPMWLVVTAPQTALGVYAGALYQTTGPAFNAVPFNPANVLATAVGNATFPFSDGNNATFAYTVNNISQVKNITREIFAPPGTVCN